MSIRGNSGDSHLVNFLQAHVQVLGDVVILSSGNESQFQVLVVNGHGIRVEGVIGLTDQVKFGPDLQVLKGLAAFPVTESGDVEVGQMDFFNELVFSCFHKASVLMGFTFIFPF